MYLYEIYGVFTLSGTKTGTGNWNKWVVWYYVKMFTYLHNIGPDLPPPLPPTAGPDTVCE